jgi:hypothetical protein
MIFSFTACFMNCFINFNVFCVIYVRKLTYFFFLFFEKINDIKDACYGNTTLDSAAHSGFSLEHLRLSLDSFQQSALDDKVTLFPALS